MTAATEEFQPLIEASADGLRRTLDLARRALRAPETVLLAPNAELDEQNGLLGAPVVPDGGQVAVLVARDLPARQWSEDDRAMLKDLADGLAAEIELTRRAARQGDRALVEGSRPTDEAAPEEARDPDTVHILLADDLDLNRKLICDMLALDGYVVDSVADGAAAVEAAQAKAYDLILMDMIMPGMDGMDATRAIRALPAPACDVPIVALTAHSFREQLDSCLHAGMNDTLTKPMSFDALSTIVGTWARGRRQAA